MTHKSFLPCRWLGVAIVCCSFATNASGDIVVEYDLTDNVSPSPAPPTTLAAGVTASDLYFGPGLTATTGPGLLTANGWTTDVEVDPDDYFGFSVTPPVGGSMTLETMTFVERRSPSGPLAFSIRSSLDGYAADIHMVMLPVDTGYRTQNVPLPAAQFSDLTETVELRIYGYASASEAGAWRLAGSGFLNDDSYPPGLTVTGSVVAGAGVPGDFDGDSIVDGKDFLIWQRGESPDPLSPTDLSAWSMNFGTVPMSASAMAVPEPTTGVLALVVLLGCNAFARRMPVVRCS